MKSVSETLTDLGYTQTLTFSFRKDINDIKSVHINTTKILPRKCKIEDDEPNEKANVFCIEVVKINLPHEEKKYFHDLENAIKYAES